MANINFSKYAYVGNYLKKYRSATSCDRLTNESIHHIMYLLGYQPFSNGTYLRKDLEMGLYQVGLPKIKEYLTRTYDMYYPNKTQGMNVITPINQHKTSEDEYVNDPWADMKKASNMLLKQDGVFYENRNTIRIDEADLRKMVNEAIIRYLYGL